MNYESGRLKSGLLLGAVEEKLMAHQRRPCFAWSVHELRGRESPIPRRLNLIHPAPPLPHYPSKACRRPRQHGYCRTGLGH